MNLIVGTAATYLTAGGVIYFYYHGNDNDVVYLLGPPRKGPDYWDAKVYSTLSFEEAFDKSGLAKCLKQQFHPYHGSGNFNKVEGHEL